MVVTIVCGLSCGTSSAVGRNAYADEVQSMAAKRRVVLVVDDEVPFLRTVSDGFQAYADEVELLTARHGREALFILGRKEVDLVVTDLHMPEMDGFELLAAMSRSYPEISVLVITAFGTADISTRLKGLGVDRYLEKPLDFNALSDRVFHMLSLRATSILSGITLSSFLQIIALDRKSCQLRVSTTDKVGHLSFDGGELIDAETGSLIGDPAGLAIVCWEDAIIEIFPARSSVSRTVQMSLTTMLIEGMRQADEKKKRDDVALAHGRKLGVSVPASRPMAPPPIPRVKVPTTELMLHKHLAAFGFAAATDGQSLGLTEPELGIKKEKNMGAKEKLEELRIDGFMGAGVFSPAGEDLALLQGEVKNIKEVGTHANNVLMNAQKASLEMGCGRGQLVHIESEKAHILVRCLNEGSDPLKAQPGRAHIHAVLILKPDASIGMAKLKIGQVTEKLADEFR